MFKNKVYCCTYVVVVMIAIFLFSGQNYNSTMKTSDIIVKPIENTIKLNDTTEFEDEKVEKDYWRNIKSKINKAVRKSAHMIIFGILAIFAYLMFKSFGLNDADAIIMTFVFCAVYAGIDEFHQKFVEGRTAQFIDVCIDEFGVFIAMVLIRLKVKIMEKRGKE